MTSIFGLCSLGIGTLLVMKCANLPVMVLATLVGALIGEFCLLEKGINGAVAKIQQLFMTSGNKPTHDSLFKVMLPSLYCFAPAAPVFSARCMKE
ncbi:Putative inner membrane protein YqgA [Salmonella enterica subsp. arizonae]|uniref:Inner membrane protein YqgA n=1 Tax=Salmonella enterica subsp. arizonae TaxID=59203 RepID=A0A379TKW3_SALER|nr:Putative inner membrane protein YqgA [Salmonella enterica subsp. arizonae]